MKSQPSTLTRVLELVGGFVIFLLGVWIWLRFFLIERSIRTNFDSPDFVLLLMLVGPGFIVAVGCYLQSVHRKPWAFGVALVGMLGTLMFIGLIARFLFAYIGDHFGLSIVWADMILLAITFIVVSVQTLRDNPVRTT